jgi:hypothetical protein
MGSPFVFYYIHRLLFIEEINRYSESTMPEKHRRMLREEKAVEAMIRIYCRGMHETRNTLCGDCGDLLDYARRRLDMCLFQEGKTSCGSCTVHCYKPAMRERIRDVMRYSGPRMLYRHPMLAFYHAIDGIRKKPVRTSRKSH